MDSLKEKVAGKCVENAHVCKKAEGMRIGFLEADGGFRADTGGTVPNGGARIRKVLKNYIR